MARNAQTIIAYTIGHEASYDEALETPPVMKLGRFVESWFKDANGKSPVYPGGIIFRDVNAAATFAEEHSEREGRPFAVYEVELQSWDDVYQHPHVGFCLRVDRPVVRKAEAGSIG